MADQQVITDEIASAIWSGDTASIAGLKETITESTTTEDDVVEEDDKKVVLDATPVSDDDITRALNGELEDEEDEPEDPKQKDAKPTPTQTQKPTDGKPGRKPADPIKFITDLVEEGELDGFEDGLPKNIDEAKALIKANIEEKRRQAVDDAFELKKKTYSPQVQTILDYAEKGIQSATELMDLIGAIKEVEDANDLDITTEAGQEAAVREAYKARGFKDTYIEKNIKRLKDLDALKEEAEELSTELVQIKAQEVKKRLEAQQKRQEDALQASKSYFKTIQDTLTKESISGIKLQKEDKAKIYAALADDRYTSLSGGKTNQFVKTLEDLQFGKDADYEHFLAIVQFAVDKQGFLDKLKQTVKNENTADTVRRLKSAKSSSANAEENQNTELPRQTIKRNTFVNPYK